MFAKITNGAVVKYPYTVGDLRRDNPNTSFPKKVPEATMAEYDMYPVGYQAAPVYNPLTHRLKHSDAPSLVDGEWKITKNVVALTSEQLSTRDKTKAKEIRLRRDKLLLETDWMALSDNTLTSDWAAYRQSLRDLTDHVNFPHLAEGDWPKKP